MTGSSSFCFLNDEHLLASAADWDNDHISRLWCYNLHYFDDLNAAGAVERVQWHHDLIVRWILENSPGLGAGWEPYPTSLRIVNWIKWAMNGNELPAMAVNSLAVQARWLRRRLEIHLLGNHLFTNAKALIFAGLFFEGAEAESWLNKGLSLLARELPEQILPDGGHFERSPMYHSIMLEDMLDIVNLSRSYSYKSDTQWDETIAKMRSWLEVMSHPDGGISFFNDAAFEVAIAPAAIEDYAQRLGYVAVKCALKPVNYLPESGYVRVMVEKVCALIDLAAVGPDYLPGHAHADTLSFELSVGEQRVLVNSGTSEYGVGAERLRQRGSAAHNTLLLDGTDSSEMWAGFRVGRRAKVTASAVDVNSKEVISVWGEHDGYQHLSGKPLHRRQWNFFSHKLTICDEVRGQGEHRIEIMFHVHPNCSAEKDDSNGVSVFDDQGSLLCAIVMQGEVELEIGASTYHPEFGLALDNQLISYRWSGNLPGHFVTNIYWK
jgi:uncharacterized heparinase superfamily protein